MLMKIHTITRTRLFKYTENFAIKNWKFSDKKIYFFIFLVKINLCDTKNNLYPCKPQFYYIKVGFKGVKII